MSSSPSPSDKQQQQLLLPPNTALTFTRNSFESALKTSKIECQRHYIHGSDRQEYSAILTIPSAGEKLPEATSESLAESLSPDEYLQLHQQRQNDMLYLFETCSGRPVENCKLFQSTLYAFDFLIIDASLLVETDQQRVAQALFQTFANDKRFHQDEYKKKTGFRFVTNWTVLEEFVWLLCSIGNDRRQRFGSSSSKNNNDNNNACNTPMRVAILYKTDEELRRVQHFLMQDKYQKLFDLFNVECKADTAFFSGHAHFVEYWRTLVKNFNTTNNHDLQQQTNSSNSSQHITQIGNLNSSATVAVLAGKMTSVIDHTTISVTGYHNTAEDRGVWVRILATSNNNRDHIRPNQCIVLYPNEIGAVKRIKAISSPFMFPRKSSTDSRSIPRASVGQIVFLELDHHEEFGPAGLNYTKHGLKTSPCLAFVGSDDFCTPRHQLYQEGKLQQQKQQQQHQQHQRLEVPVSCGANPPDFSYLNHSKSRTKQGTVEYATVDDPTAAVRKFTDGLNTTDGKNFIQAEIPSATPLNCYSDEEAKSFFDTQNDTRSFATTTPLFASMVRLCDICPEVLSHDPAASTIHDSIFALRRLYATNLDSINDSAKLKRQPEHESKIQTSTVGECFVCGPNGMSLATTVLRRTFDGYSSMEVPKEQAADDFNDKTGKPCVFDVTLRPISDNLFGPLMLTKQQEDEMNSSYHSNFFGTKFSPPGTGDTLKQFLASHPLVLVVHSSPNRAERGLVIQPFVLLRSCSTTTLATGIISCLENKPLAAISPQVRNKLKNEKSGGDNDDDNGAQCPDCCRTFLTLNDIFPEIFHPQIVANQLYHSSKQLTEVRMTLIQVLLGDLSSFLQYDRGYRCRLVNLLQTHQKITDNRNGDAAAVDEKSVLLRKSLATLLSPSTDVSVTYRTLASLLSCVNCETCSELWMYELLVLGTDRYDLQSSFGMKQHSCRSKTSGSLYYSKERLSFAKMIPFHLRKIYVGVGVDMLLYEKMFLSYKDAGKVFNPFTFLLFSTVLNRRAMDCLVTAKMRTDAYPEIVDMEKLFYSSGKCISSPENSIIPDLIAARAGHGAAIRRLINEKAAYASLFNVTYSYATASFICTSSSKNDTNGCAIKICEVISDVVSEVFKCFGFASWSAIETLLKFEICMTQKDATLLDVVKKYAVSSRATDRWGVQTENFYFGSGGRDLGVTLIRRLPWVKSFARTRLIEDLSNNPPIGKCLMNSSGSVARGIYPAQRVSSTTATGGLSSATTAAAPFFRPTTLPSVNRPYLTNTSTGQIVRIADSIGKGLLFKWIGSRMAKYDEKKRSELELKKLASHHDQADDAIVLDSDYSGNSLIVLFQVMDYLTPVAVTVGSRTEFSISEAALFGV